MLPTGKRPASSSQPFNASADGEAPGVDFSQLRTALYEPLVYTHESQFKSEHIIISVRCPDAWIYSASLEDDGMMIDPFNGDEPDLDIPVFGPNDLVGGSVLLSPDIAHQRGKLNISVEGKFTFISPNLPPPPNTNLPRPLSHEHTFFTGSMAFATYPPSPQGFMNISRGGRRRAISEGAKGKNWNSVRNIFGIKLGSTFNKAFFTRLSGSFSPNGAKNDQLGDVDANLVREFRKSTTRSQVLSWNSQAMLPPREWTPYSFSFPLPKPITPSQASENSEEQPAALQMPPSFSSSHITDPAGIRGRAFAENAEVSYKITAQWESIEEDTEQQRKILLEAPFLYMPVQDDIPPSSVLSSKSVTVGIRSWGDYFLEPDPTSVSGSPAFYCKLTLPYPAVFSRSKSVPYFIQCYTAPLYHFLAKDIRREATVIISLVRTVTMDGSVPCFEVSNPLLPISLPFDIANLPGQRRGINVDGYIDLAQHQDNAPRSPTFLERLTTPIRGKRRPASASLKVQQAFEPKAEIPKVKYLAPEKKLPTLPPGAESVVSESRVILREVIVGLKKRPRTAEDKKAAQRATGENDSVFETDDRSSTSVSFSADGRSKPVGAVFGKLKLNKEMLLSIGWIGLLVDYYLDVEVKYGSDVVRCRAGVTINADTS